jgi:predicted  nucleic acid-binding Zn-ribbon protein
MDMILNEQGKLVPMVKGPSQIQEENEATLRREVIRLTHVNEDLEKQVAALKEDLLASTKSVEEAALAFAILREEFDRLKGVHAELVNEIPKLNKRYSKKVKADGQH